MPKNIIDAEKLPAHKIADAVNQQLEEHNSLVITAPPGAGKSTLLPLTIMQHLDNSTGKVLMLEPRRLAARQIAERMSYMLGEPVGKTVGYRVRHETKVSKDTRIEVITEGILTRMLVSDSTLEGVSVVIFDEFHERSIHSDVALALTRESQQIIRPDLRIVIMSATIDTAAICQALDAPLVQSEGKMHPVEIRYSSSDIPLPPWNNPKETLTDIVRTIISAHRDNEGDILVFLPGESEIRRCQEMLGTSLGSTNICPLYGLLSPQEQRLAIAPSQSGERKIVLATSIAETSITIEGVRVVIDTGLCRKMTFDPRSSLSHLETVRISMDMARQRSGRAGRVAPGVCYRLWNKATELRMEECRTPEIEEADLSPMLLDIAAWGESDASNLLWLTPPPSPHVKQGASLLLLLGATDQDGKITAHGRKLWHHSYHPRLAQMVVKAESMGKVSEAIKLAEALENRKITDSHWGETEGALLAYAFPERIAQQQKEGIGNYRLANGANATVESSSPLTSHEWIVIANMNATGNGNIHLAAPLSFSDLKQHAQERNNISWDNKQGTIIARREQRIGNLLISSRPISDGNRELITHTICEAAKKLGTSMLSFSDDVLHLQRRIATASQWHPELHLPDLSTDIVLQSVHDWLPLYIGKATTTSELKKIDLTTVFWSLLTYDQQQDVDRIVPTHIKLPSGRRAKIEYRQGAEQPILRIRLQECFGMQETPRVDDGTRPILMELLSPGFKPVQLTQDLRSFWSTTYFDVRKELKRRYPKHAWPENPNQ